MSKSPVHQNDVSNNGDTFFKEIVKVLAIAVVIVLPIRILIAQPFIVSGSSMDPTFTNGDYLIVDQISYRFEDPERLDVIIFRYPDDPKKFFIKRIIGLPGETISIIDGSVSIDSPELGIFNLEEPYITHERRDSVKLSLDEHEYFVMGDNRFDSLDSRIWGALPEENITGKAILRLLPVNKFGINPGTIF